jgi:pilus assembly protein Flp/PilA
MSHALIPIRRLGKDEDGAALIEYTVLLGVLLVAVIAVIGSVGAWVGGQWSSLCKALPGATC